MTAIHAFWAAMAWVNTLSPGHACEALTQSTHSVPEHQQVVIYMGNCTQAFQLALYGIAKGIAWVIL